jgi:hypothetical protein
VHIIHVIERSLETMRIAYIDKSLRVSLRYAIDAAPVGVMREINWL